ncbi:hypothetical protein PpBr36_01174 [Pyricularia pennisetigena]|uniref:hypothetical protein n=1 Tax=Pyricularia pennisetigena TaxID=1578925 RepID=UPI00114DE919|nr:hypothetical protein PpBr36_01174 [Pyricularia pennisetigena]TLS29430.1 hypothetical protein PpBr36_01174 [Pyricularia pennisetigena]
MKRRRLSCWRWRRIPVGLDAIWASFGDAPRGEEEGTTSGCHGANIFAEPRMQFNSTKRRKYPLRYPRLAQAQPSSAAQTTSRKLGAGFTKFELNHSNKGALLFSDDSYPTTILLINLAINFATFNLPSPLVKNIGRPDIYWRGLCTGLEDARDLCSHQQQSTTTAAFREFCTMPIIHCTHS